LARGLLTDLDGNPRIQGSHVDIGGYETAPEPAAVTYGAVSLSVLAAYAFLRRRIGS
jgi:MYXO-CTERM domain-containing protein